MQSTAAHAHTYIHTRARASAHSFIQRILIRFLDFYFNSTVYILWAKQIEGTLIMNLKNVKRNVGENHESARVRPIDTIGTVIFLLKISVICSMFFNRGVHSSDHVQGMVMSRTDAFKYK
jgi:hypothetical protein